MVSVEKSHNQKRIVALNEQSEPDCFMNEREQTKIRAFQTYVKLIAESFHQNIKSCYRSERAYFVWGDKPLEDMEWVKKRNGKWNGYPPAKWTNPAVNCENGIIKIVTSGGDKITLPKINKQILGGEFYWLRECVFASFKGGTMTGFIPKNNKWVEKKSIILPWGYIFGKDKLGVKIVEVATGADYHFNDVDINYKTPEMLVQLLQENKEKNRLAKIQEENNKKNEFFFKKNLRNTRVLLEDSRAVGNCVEGSLKFVERNLKISRETILAAPYFIGVAANRIAKFKDDRAMRAARRAFDRETVISI